MNEKESEAYKLGYQNGLKGKDSSSNPFESLTEQSREFFSGLVDGKAQAIKERTANSFLGKMIKK